jgi:hypothetical protein
MPVIRGTNWLNRAAGGSEDRETTGSANFAEACE